VDRIVVGIRRSFSLVRSQLTSTRNDLGLYFRCNGADQRVSVSHILQMYFKYELILRAAK
jgi:hypothetical protein